MGSVLCAELGFRGLDARGDEERLRWIASESVGKDMSSGVGAVCTAGSAVVNMSGIMFAVGAPGSVPRALRRESLRFVYSALAARTAGDSLGIAGGRFRPPFAAELVALRPFRTTVVNPSWPWFPGAEEVLAHRVPTSVSGDIGEEEEVDIRSIGEVGMWGVRCVAIVRMEAIYHSGVNQLVCYVG
jgi:hypothetical protein